jgi:hypothetical protein
VYSIVISINPESIANKPEYTIINEFSSIILFSFGTILIIGGSITKSLLLNTISGCSNVERDYGIFQI